MYNDYQIKQALKMLDDENLFLDIEQEYIGLSVPRKTSKEYRIVSVYETRDNICIRYIASISSAWHMFDMAGKDNDIITTDVNKYDKLIHLELTKKFHKKLKEFVLNFTDFTDEQKELIIKRMDNWL